MALSNKEKAVIRLLWGMTNDACQEDGCFETDGGAGSGNWGHKGRPGKKGGSGAGGGKKYRSGSKEEGYSQKKLDPLGAVQKVTSTGSAGLARSVGGNKFVPAGKKQTAPKAESAATTDLRNAIKNGATLRGLGIRLDKFEPGTTINWTDKSGEKWSLTKTPTKPDGSGGWWEGTHNGKYDNAVSQDLGYTLKNASSFDVSEPGQNAAGSSATKTSSAKAKKMDAVRQTRKQLSDASKQYNDLIQKAANAGYGDQSAYKQMDKIVASQPVGTVAIDSEYGGFEKKADGLWHSLSDPTQQPFSDKEFGENMWAFDRFDTKEACEAQQMHWEERNSGETRPDDYFYGKRIDPAEAKKLKASIDADQKRVDELSDTIIRESNRIGNRKWDPKDIARMEAMEKEEADLKRKIEDTIVAGRMGAPDYDQQKEVLSSPMAQQVPQDPYAKSLSKTKTAEGLKKAVNGLLQTKQGSMFFDANGNGFFVGYDGKLHSTDGFVVNPNDKSDMAYNAKNGTFSGNGALVSEAKMDRNTTRNLLDRNNSQKTIASMPTGAKIMMPPLGMFVKSDNGWTNTSPYSGKETLSDNDMFSRISDIRGFGDPDAVERSGFVTRSNSYEHRTPFVAIMPTTDSRDKAVRSSDERGLTELASW